MPPMRLPDSDIPIPDNPEALLARFQPQPGLRLHQWAKIAPWSRQPIVFARRLAWAGMAGLLVLLAVGFLTIPSLRAIARQLLLTFSPAPADELTMQVTLASSEELLNFTDPASFTMTLEEVTGLVGYTVRRLDPAETGLELVGARYLPDIQSIILLYRGADYDLYLSQRPLEGGQDLFSIGASADVQSVQVGNVQGEFVAGGWIAEPGFNLPATIAPGAQIELGATWDPALPQYTLRWQEAGYAYELRSAGVHAPQKTDLIALAGLLK